jgi:superfamily II DNA or RNA helicase
MKWREGVDLPDLPVVIRADGQCGLIASIQIGGRVSRTHESKSIGLVIDFRDHFCKETYDKSCAKIGHYRAEGWRVIEWKV